MENLTAAVSSTAQKTGWRTAHFASGLLLTVFVGMHLTNHLVVLISPATHIAFMKAARVVYRNPVVEALLLGAVLLQIITGLRLALGTRRIQKNTWERLHVVSGLYLAFFLLLHIATVLSGRYLFHLDTNLYFGAGGLNQFPLLLFFVPCYSLAVVAFFAHIASIHRKKMTLRVATLSVEQQSWIIILAGFLLTITLMYGLTNGFRGLPVPAASSLITR